MNIKARILSLRDKMIEKELDAYVIHSADPHQSECAATHWQARKWISGFSGSAGTVVILQDKAGLWTDGRYHIQAEEQLIDSGIELFKAGLPNVPNYQDWIVENIDENAKIGFDGRTFSRTFVENFRQKTEKKHAKIVSDFDLIGNIWSDRPPLPKQKAYELPLKYAGKSTSQKLEEIRSKMTEKEIDWHLLTSLDDIAWLLNIRGNDIAYSPVVISYVAISQDRSFFFVDKEKISTEIQEILSKQGVSIKAYEEIGRFVSEIKSQKILLDPNKTSHSLVSSINESCKIVEERQLTEKMKALKNETEIENLRKCHILDSAALTKFFYWLDSHIGKQKITELSAAQRLEEFRSEQNSFLGSSFSPIAAYKEHAALMHYSPSEKTDAELKPEGFFLIDSGGHYWEGTTDITRTVRLGKLSSEEIKDFTLVLKGNIHLSKARFLKGTCGANLDILSRKPLWDEGLDYKCGTGHGVGYLLNVHEGPQGFSQFLSKIPLEIGMTTTVEPGVYKEGKHGVRIENTILTVMDRETDFGTFYKFEMLTYCPIDARAINFDLLTIEEKEWLEDYQKTTFAKLSPHLTKVEKEWLRAFCKI